MTLAYLTNGMKALGQLIGTGHTVPLDVAQKRTEICLLCPMNVQDRPITETAVGIVTRAVELLHNLDMEVVGHGDLHVCSGCDCALKTKVWMPGESIVPTEDEKSKFHEKCWLLKL